MRSLKCIAALLSAGTLFSAPPASPVKPGGEGFMSPAEAGSALVSAAKSGDIEKVIAVLGPGAKDLLVTSDPVADQQMRRKFVEAADRRIRIVADRFRPGEKTLLVGKDEWPLPIPIVHINGKWYFDLDQGKQEILARRIGSNELDAIEVCRGYVEAQNDYAERVRAGSGVPHYAQKIISSPGQQDGLYWPATGKDDESPIGDIITRAFAEGYTRQHAPYHGYYFKILTGQGAHATGGGMSYIQDGLMTKGFALIAWPADFGSTGMMTFVVDKSGIVYQKNLGSKTAQIASGYTLYDPDESWAPVAMSARK